MTRRESIARRLRRATMALALVGVPLLAVPAGASANWYSSSCYDYAGWLCMPTSYTVHGLIQVDTLNYGAGENLHYTCAEAWTAAGNARSYSGCTVWGWFRRSNLTSTSPSSYGEGYYWYGGPAWYTAYSCTPSDVGVCNNLP